MNELLCKGLGLAWGLIVHQKSFATTYHTLDKLNLEYYVYCINCGGVVIVADWQERFKRLCPQGSGQSHWPKL